MREIATGYIPEVYGRSKPCAGGCGNMVRITPKSSPAPVCQKCRTRICIECLTPFPSRGNHVFCSVGCWQAWKAGKNR